MWLGCHRGRNPGGKEEAGTEWTPEIFGCKSNSSNAWKLALKHPSDISALPLENLLVFTIAYLLVLLKNCQRRNRSRSWVLLPYFTNLLPNVKNDFAKLSAILLAIFKAFLNISNIQHQKLFRAGTISQSHIKSQNTSAFNSVILRRSGSVR